MRCPSCNKFVSMEDGEPEAEIDVNDCVVSGTVRIVRNCGECGTELKESTLDVAVDLKTILAEDHKPAETEDGEPHEMEVEVDSCDATEKGGGRYAKSYHGFELAFTVKCSCGAKESGTASDEIAASHMDELV